METLTSNLPSTQDQAAIESRVGSYTLSQVVDQQLWKSKELAKVANVTFPTTALDQLPPLHRPSISLIEVNTAANSKDTYRISGGQMGLSKHVILKMLNAAGASYRTEKLTKDSDLDNIRWAAYVWGRLPDGTPHQAQGSKAWSWEKCQMEMKPEQAKQYRQFADEQTETKALLRAARAFLNIQTSYSQEELQKPFLVARSVVDTSNPVVQQAAAEVMKESMKALFGPSAPVDAPQLDVPKFTALPAEATDDEFAEDGVFTADDDFDPLAMGDEADPLEEGQQLTIDEQIQEMASTPEGKNALIAACKHNGRNGLKGASDAVKMAVLQDAITVLGGGMLL